METLLTPAQPRSLVRRLIPWTAALGLFAGGGYGVYRYAVPPSSGDAAIASAEESDDAGGLSAKAQIKNLFAPPAEKAPAGARQPGASDRYAMQPAPVLPPAKEVDEVATPRSAAAVSPPANPFSTMPVGGGDRYGAAPDATPAEPAVSETPETNAAPSTALNDSAAVAPPTVEAIADEPTEIARGQEPSSGNPLRSPERQMGGGAAAESDAQAAFADSPSKAAATAASTAIDAGALMPKSGSGAAAAAMPDPANDASRYAGDTAAQFAPTASGRSMAPAPAANVAAENNMAAENSIAGDDATGLYRPADNEPTEPRVATASPAATPLRDRTAAGILSATERQPGADVTPTPGLAAVDGEGRPGDRMLEGVQAPTLAVQKLAPAEIQVGRKCTFAVRVQNTSQRTIHDVQVRDQVPLGTQLVGAAPKASVAGAEVTWDLGTLNPGEERIVEMELMPTDEGELGSVATVTFASHASAKVRCTRPELALRLSSGPRVMLGQQHIVQIEVSNPGSGDATGVMLLESVPAGVSHEAGPALEFPVGTIAAGDSKRLELVLTAEQAGKINNVMTARADASLQVQANCEFEVIAPDLAVTVDGPQRRYLERPATYTVSVDNPGTATAKEVQLVTQLPKGLQFVSANNMGEYDAATHSIYWSLAELPANERGTVELTALPVEAGEHTLQVATRAQQGLEDRTETRVKVEGLVALSFEVAAVDGAIELGGETAYEITVVNQGSKSAANVQVVAVTPPGIRAIAAAGETRYEVQGDRVVFAPTPQLAPKAEAKFRVRVQGTQSGDQRTRVQVTAAEVQDPITKELSTQVYADQ